MTQIDPNKTLNVSSPEPPYIRTLCIQMQVLAT